MRYIQNKKIHTYIEYDMISLILRDIYSLGLPLQGEPKGRVEKQEYDIVILCAIKERREKRKKDM